MRVQTIAAIDVTIGMKLRSFTTPDAWYVVDSIEETETGRKFWLISSLDNKRRMSFFDNDENCKILHDDPILHKVVMIECPYCEATMPICLYELNQNFMIECPDCEREFLSKTK